MPNDNSPYLQVISAPKSREAKTDPYATGTTYPQELHTRWTIPLGSLQVKPKIKDQVQPLSPKLGPRFKCWNMWARQGALELCHLLTVCFLRLLLHLQGWDNYACPVDSCLSYYLTRSSWVSNKVGWEVLFYIIKVVPTWCLWECLKVSVKLKEQ